jgi:acyl carrier protein
LSESKRYLKEDFHKPETTKLYHVVLSETIDLIKTEIETIDRVEPHSSLLGDLDLDSVEVMEMIEIFENKFNIEIPIDRLPELNTVEDLVRLIYPLIQKKYR